jgi:hypothetical protein
MFHVEHSWEFSLGEGRQNPGAMFHVEHYSGWDPVKQAYLILDYPGM